MAKGQTPVYKFRRRASLAVPTQFGWLSTGELMSTWSEYLVVMGFLLLIYCFFRILVSWGVAVNEDPPSFVPTDWKRTADPGKPIDTSALSARVGSVRQAYQRELRPKPMSFKRVLRIRDKREEIGQRAFFRRAGSVEPFDEERVSAY